MSTPQWRQIEALQGPPGPPGPSIEVLPFSMHGQVRVASGLGRFPITGGAYWVRSVAATVEEAPTGSPIVADVRANGVSLYAAHPSRRPTIPVSGHLAAVGAHTATVVRDGDFLSVDVVAVGSAVPGRTLVVVVRLEQIVAEDL